MSDKHHGCRLASFICGYEVFQIAVSSSYGVTEFKENLLSLYNLAGVKGTSVTFLITDNQIVKEKFLVYINDLLSTGYIADLCTQASPRSPEGLPFLYRFNGMKWDMFPSVPMPMLTPLHVLP